MWNPGARRRLLLSGAGHLAGVGTAGAFAFAYFMLGIGGFRYPTGAERFAALLTVLLPLLAVTFGVQLASLPELRVATGRLASLGLGAFGGFVVGALGAIGAASALTRHEECVLVTPCVTLPAPWVYSLFWAAYVLAAAWLIVLGVTWAVVGKALTLSGSVEAGGFLVAAGVGSFLPFPFFLGTPYILAGVGNGILGSSMILLARKRPAGS